MLHVTPPNTGPPDPYNWVWHVVIAVTLFVNLLFGHRKVSKWKR